MEKEKKEIRKDVYNILKKRLNDLYEKPFWEAIWIMHHRLPLNNESKLLFKEFIEERMKGLIIFKIQDLEIFFSNLHDKTLIFGHANNNELEIIDDLTEKHVCKGERI